LICTNGKVVNPNQRRGIAMKIIRSQNKKNINGQTLIVAVLESWYTMVTLGLPGGGSKVISLF